MKAFQLIRTSALPLLFALPAMAAAQEVEPTEAIPSPPAANEDQRIVNFSADQFAYDTSNEIVTASGEVRMVSEGYRLRADRVTWNRTSGEVKAEGNIQVTNPEGDIAYGDSIVLTDTLRDGMVENMLLVLENGGRLAAERAERRDGYTILHRAAYSPCAVVDENGCPKEPTWQINAVRVEHDPVRRRIRYEGASLNLFGVPIIALPGLSHPDGSGEGGSGLLVPVVRFSRNNGLELSAPYYWRFGTNRDLTVEPHLYTQVLPALEARYRQLTELGAFQVGGFITYGSRLPVNVPAGVVADEDKGIRAYIEGNGRFQLDPLWSVTAAGRYVTDRTFLRRYDISRDDRLRSVVNVERIAEDSYISIAGWAFQGLRSTDVDGMQPIALPAIDARWRLPNQLAGGRIELQANSLAILRTEGQDTQRAFASARWDNRSITPWGQEVVLTAYGRGDVYHTAETALTPELYRGRSGWHGRAIGAVAVDVKWPLIGAFLAGAQRLTPRLQVVASPATANLDIPNEDARSVDLEDSNLFALNRFPGYDRWENGTRIVYGLDWAYDARGVAVRSTVGQSYRLSRQPSILPEGTGLADRFSDIVGRTTVRVGRFVDLTHRFRLDKDGLAIRRNEIDAVVGTRGTYASVGYLRLDRDISLAIEDLRDREEVRVGGRVEFLRHWSLFGSAVVDLTDSREDPSSSADGYQPIRHRLGIAYDDDCIELGVTWRRDYETAGDFERGNTFLFRVALKNLGR